MSFLPWCWVAPRPKSQGWGEWTKTSETISPHGPFLLVSYFSQAFYHRAGNPTYSHQRDPGMGSNSLHKPRAAMLHEITPSPVPRILTVMNFVMLPPGVAGDVQPFFIGKGATLQSPEFRSTVYLDEHRESLSSLTGDSLTATVSCYPQSLTQPCSCCFSGPWTFLAKLHLLCLIGFLLNSLFLMTIHLGQRFGANTWIYWATLSQDHLLMRPVNYSNIYLSSHFISFLNKIPDAVK